MRALALAGCRTAPQYPPTAPPPPPPPPCSGAAAPQPLSGVALRESGEFKMGEGKPWIPLRATQHVSLAPPGFVWHARMRMAPLLWVEGEAATGARLLPLPPAQSHGVAALGHSPARPPESPLQGVMHGCRARGT